MQMARIRKPQSVHRPSFFKVLLGDFTKKMRIPPAFIKNFHGKFIDESILKCRNGRSWPVKVKKDVRNLFFQNGWQGFVKDNLLEAGDFLVFRYVSKSVFDVQIFGKNGCEKVEALPQKKERRKIKISVCRCKYKSVVSAKKNSEKIESKERMAVVVKEKMVFEAVFCPLKLKHPHFTGIWRPCHPYHVTIPKVFAIENGLKRKLSRFLSDRSGKLWPVTITHRSDGRSDLGNGWRDFCAEKKLRKGDKCVFEFIKLNVIRVHIIRGNE